MKFKPMPFLRYFGRWYMLAILLGCIAMQIIPFQMTYEEDGILKYFAHIFFFVLTCLYVYGLHKELWDKFFATIYISPEEIVWKCPFRKTIHLPTAGCYMGVELENSYNKFLEAIDFRLRAVYTIGNNRSTTERNEVLCLKF